MRNLIVVLTLLAVAACAPCSSIKADAVSPTTLHIDFQDGFPGTRVITYIDGKVTFNKTLSTNNLIGVAGGFDYATAKDTVKITFKSPAVEFTKSLHVADGSYIGISIKDGKVKLVQSKTVFFYD